MTVQHRLQKLQHFFRSGPMRCPYLPSRIEQQVFTELSGPEAQDVFETLSAGGFRRSHHIAYRPSCRGCNACMPVRIDIAGFRTGKSWRRIHNANADLTGRMVGKRVSEEQYALFRDYVNSRHGDGEMAKMSRRDYAAMVVSSPVDTGIVEFRDKSRRLVAACLYDRMRDGFSAVYSFFDASQAKRSLGTYMVLWLVERCRQEGLGHVYLGFWVEGSSKMDYKRRFAPLEGFTSDGWKALDSGN